MCRCRFNTEPKRNANYRQPGINCSRMREIIITDIVQYTIVMSYAEYDGSIYAMKYIHLHMWLKVRGLTLVNMSVRYI